MKAIYVAVALATAAAVGATGAAFAAAAPPAGATATVTIAPADATAFKTWVATQKPATVAVPAGFTVAVGAVVPMNVTLVAIPDTAKIPTLVKYQYVVLGDKTVLVDPMSRKIVYIVG